MHIISFILVLLLISRFALAQDPIVRPKKLPSKEQIKSKKKKNKTKVFPKHEDKKINPPEKDNNTRPDDRAVTLFRRAEQREPKAMYDLACAYHEGAIPEIAKDDYLSYLWMMRYYTICNKDDGVIPLYYIKNNLRKGTPERLTPIFGWSKDVPTELSLKTCFLHPIAVIPISELVNLSLSKLKKHIMDNYKWKNVENKYDKKEIRVWKTDGNEMPTLFGIEVDRMECYKHSSKQFNYDYDFIFTDRRNAEEFLYKCAYNAMGYGLVYEKMGGEKPRNLTEDIAIGADCMMSINNKQFRFTQTLYLFDHSKTGSGVTVCLEMSFIR